MYLFGGLSSEGVYLNDFWRFNLVSEKWELLESETIL
jgi:hypothetical protein